MKKITAECLDLAFSDLENIRLTMHAEYLTHLVAFHAQQAIEKTFKSILEKVKNDVPKIHNLNKLYSLILEIKPQLIIDLERLEKINEIYTDSRYPRDLGLLPDGKPSTEEAREFYNFALDIYEQVKNLLRGEIK